MKDCEYFKKEFNAEIREKKLPTYSAGKKASKVKGFKGSIVFPNSNVKGKEKKELKGEIILRNINFENIEWRDFKKLDESEQLFGIEFLIKKYGYHRLFISNIFKVNQMTISRYFEKLSIDDKISNIDAYSCKIYLDSKKEIRNKYIDDNKIKNTNIYLEESKSPINEEQISHQENNKEKINEKTKLVLEVIKEFILDEIKCIPNCIYTSYLEFIDKESSEINEKTKLVLEVIKENINESIRIPNCIKKDYLNFIENLK